MAVCTGLFPRHRPDKTCCTVLDAGENMVFPAVSLLAFVAALMCVFYVGFSLDCSSEDPPSHLGVMYPQTHWRGGENKKLHLEIPIQGMVCIQLSLDCCFDVFNGLHQAVNEAGALFPTWPCVFVWLSLPVAFRY